MLLGEEAHVYDVHRFLITSVDLPVVAQIIEASPEKRYLRLVLQLDQRATAQPMVDSSGNPCGASRDEYPRNVVFGVHLFPRWKELGRRAATATLETQSRRGILMIGIEQSN